MWISFSGCKPTREELALKWPEDKETAIQRKLRDEEEEKNFPGEHDGPREFTVTEKTGTDGRRFWREVIKQGELNDEEADKDWDEWMREDGHY